MWWQSSRSAFQFISQGLRCAMQCVIWCTGLSHPYNRLHPACISLCRGQRGERTRNPGAPPSVPAEHKSRISCRSAFECKEGLRCVSWQQKATGSSLEPLPSTSPGHRHPCPAEDGGNNSYPAPECPSGDSRVCCVSEEQRTEPQPGQGFQLRYNLKSLIFFQTTLNFRTHNSLNV